MAGLTALAPLSKTKKLFDVRVVGDYDITADGQRFLVLTNATEGASDPITVVLNCQAG